MTTGHKKSQEKISQPNNSSTTSKCVRTFMCGQLDAELTNSLDSRWQEQLISKAQYEKNCDYYYKSYINSLYKNPDNNSEGIYGQLAEYKLNTQNLNTACTLKKFDETNSEVVASYDFELEGITLYQFPHNIVLYSIEISEKNIKLNDLTMLHSILRDVAEYDTLKDRSWVLENYQEIVIEPLAEICRRSKGSFKDIDLVKNGNKLKLFQVIEASEYYSLAQSNSDDATNKLLYELATLSPIGAVDDRKNKFSPSDNSFNNIINTYLIEPFRNWKALSLFDTFTVIYNSNFELEDWRRYFRLIYLHVLFQKNILFEINRDFRVAAMQKTKLNLLVDKMNDHECYHSFSNISYNVMPQMLYEHIVKSLNVEDEREQLRYYVERESERQEKKKGQFFATLLGFVTLLSIASALADATSLFTALTDNLKDVCVYQTFCLGVAIFIIAVAVAIFLYNKDIWFTKKNKPNNHK